MKSARRLFVLVVLAGCGPEPAPSPPTVPTRTAAEVSELHRVSPEVSASLVGKTVRVETANATSLGHGWLMARWPGRVGRYTVVFQVTGRQPEHGRPGAFVGTYYGLRAEGIAGCPVPGPFVFVGGCEWSPEQQSR